ncbi:MAG: hypothetical protein ACYCTL_02495 [Acidimicrobiales bacterium]
MLGAPESFAARTSRLRGVRSTGGGSHPAYRDHYQRTAARLGRQRGKKVARVEVARKLADAIWHMLTKGEPFAPHIEPAKKMAA